MRLFFTFILLVNTSVLFSQQNLVPNPGFEENNPSDSCEAGFQNSIPPWINAVLIASPNCFKECCPDPQWGIPSNNLGYQNSHNGVGYAGFGTYVLQNANFREYIEIELTLILVKNRKYLVQFYTSLADKSRYGSSYGVYFSDTLIFDNYIGPPYYYSPLYFEPQLKTPTGDSVITDTTNWTLVSGIYCAHGGERYLTIGNFDNDINVDTIDIHTPLPSGFSKHAYYYIDDVSVSLFENSYCSENSITICNVFTPNNDGINDLFKPFGQNIKSLYGKIFNRWGQEIFSLSELNTEWDGKYNGRCVSDGTYFYIIQVEYYDGKQENIKGSITVIR